MLPHSGRHPLPRPHPQLYRHPAQAPFTRAQISPIGPRRSPLPAAGIKNGLSNYADIKRSIWPIRGQNRAIFIIVSSEVKRAEPESEPFSSPVLRSKVRWAWIWSFVFVLLSWNGGVVFESVTPPCNGNGLGVAQATIQNRASGRHVAQKCAPFL